MRENFFSPIAANYARYRPTYPPALYAYLASLVPGRELAWDCATGSGQAAAALVGYFDHVIATDISEELLAQAVPHARISYRRADAVSSGIGAGAVDLVTVANAMHWFHGEAFAAEVRRVLRPGGLIAAWSFAYSRISPDVDRVTRKLHDQIVDPFWIGPNRIVERGYKDLHFPFTEVQPPPFHISTHYDLAALAGYLRTWSACTKYRNAHGVDPVSLVEEELRAAWGEPTGTKEVRWDLNLRVGMIGK